MKRMLKNESLQGDCKLKIDWHSSLLTRATNVDKNYKNTQNVRRFMIKECGDDFRFDVAP